MDANIFTGGDLNVVDEVEPEIFQDSELVDDDGLESVDDEYLVKNEPECDSSREQDLLFVDAVKQESSPGKNKEKPAWVEYSCLDKSCSFKAHKKYELTSHMKQLHKDFVKEFSCSECSYTSTSKGNLTKHVTEVHAKEKQYMCTYCGAQTSRKYHLSRHIKAVHQGEKFFCCQQCSYKTNNNLCLKKHVAEVHELTAPSQDLVPQVSESELTCICTWCEYRSNKYSDIKRHIRTVHEKYSQYPCKECLFEAKTVESYAEHYNQTHKIEQYKHACGECDYRTSNKVNMKDHYLNVHKKRKVYVCKLCNFKSVENSSMKRHIRNAHKSVKVN